MVGKELKELKKLIKAEFKDVLAEFSQYRHLVYIKVTDDNIIHNVTFEFGFGFGSGGFVCSVAMQPLYVKDINNLIHITFGGRLSRFNNLHQFKGECWLYEDAKKGIVEIKELLVKNGLPWFSKYGSPTGIIEFIRNTNLMQYGIPFFNDFHQKQFLGFSLLYIGKFYEGIRYLDELISSMNHDRVPDKFVTYKHQLINLVEQLKDNPEKTPDVLQSIIQENKACLKIQ